MDNSNNYGSVETKIKLLMALLRSILCARVKIISLSAPISPTNYFLFFYLVYNYLVCNEFWPWSSIPS